MDEKNNICRNPHTENGNQPNSLEPDLVVKPWFLGLNQVKPKEISEVHLHVDPPPVGRSVNVG